MNITKTLEQWLSRTFRKVWDNRNMARQPAWLICMLSIVLSVLGVWFKVEILESHTPPFLFFFVVVTLTAFFAGTRGAFVGTAVTTLSALILHFSGNYDTEIQRVFSFLQVLLYFLECIFLTALLHRFQLNEKRCALQHNLTLKAKAEIEAREKLHEDFVHMATHELKAPVTVLKAYLQLADMKIKGSGDPAEASPTREIPQFSELLGKMNFQLDKLVDLINDLLESTRVGSGALNCQFVPFDLLRCLRECVEGFKAAHPTAIIRCEIPGDRLVISGDESRIEQVILNLLSNAVKYSPAGADVLVVCAVQENKVTVSVKDRGMGIPEDMKAAVFSRFVRVKSPEMSKLSGLGLGLYICSEIVKAHGGTIGVDSILGRGSTFWFTVPIQHTSF